MIICNDEKYNKIREFIFEQFINHNKNIDNIITLIDKLEQKKREKFLKELMEKCKFNKNEFYSREENNKINLLCSLYEKEK